MMTQILPLHAWTARAATSLRQVPHPALVALWASSITRRWACAQRVRWVSIRHRRLKARASIVLLVNMRTLLGRAAAQRVSQASTQVQLVYGSVTCAVWVVTPRQALHSVVCVRQVSRTTTVTRLHRVSNVRLVGILLQGRLTARYARLVGPILTAILRQCAMVVLRATMLQLAWRCAHLVLRVSMMTTVIRARRA